ncbi:YmfL family putative regulatory protein [Ewingella americana]|uniref:YmfL family putative regulatory protein n=1 Tax=Ewingella americana TaxID=41202 RepID=UPI00163B0211|nr:YmfL family putative regulatory protein [Ewingella americana]QMV54103.1 DNA-binding protein [Ewingella americana]
MDNKNYPVPEDITGAMHKLITSYAGGYGAMAEQLAHDGTHNALSNRVRQVGGQVVPFGMALMMEEISGRHDITEAICRRAGGAFVKFPEVEQMGNEELLVKFNELLAALGQFASAHNEFTADNYLDRDESKRLRIKGYRVQALVAEILVVTEMLFGKVEAPSVQLGASGALTKQCGVGNA